LFGPKWVQKIQQQPTLPVGNLGLNGPLFSWSRGRRRAASAALTHLYQPRVGAAAAASFAAPANAPAAPESRRIGWVYLPYLAYGLPYY